MKKILFLQALKNSAGGVWYVNQTLASEFLKKGYDVTFLYVRKDATQEELFVESSIQQYVINENDPWETTPYSESIQQIKKGKLFQGMKSIIKTYIFRKKMAQDFEQAKLYIQKETFDFIISAHYQVLDCIPMDYYKKTVHVVHTSFSQSMNHMGTKRVLEAYKHKLRFVWLSKASCELAKEAGFDHSHFIYNPLRIALSNPNQIKKQKTMVTLARLSSEKNIDQMIDIVEEVCKELKVSDWSLHIYGDGPLRSMLEEKVKHCKYVKLHKSISDPAKVLSEAAIYLCTSSFEGFPMSILEAYACEVPAITYRFGESCEEVVVPSQTGFIVSQGDKEQFKQSLCKLMTDDHLRVQLGKQSYEYVKQFQIDQIINQWLSLMNHIE